MMYAPHARAVDIALAALCGALGAIACEKTHADIGVRGVLVPQTLHGCIVEVGEMLIVFHGVLDAHRAAAIDVLDEILDELRDLLTVADGVDDRDALRGREVVRRSGEPRERDVGP